MGEIKVEYIKVDDLIPYENNPRHNDEAVEYVANSIHEFGFRVPLVIDENNVIVTGHTRLKAAKRLGLEKVPCTRADDLSPEQVKAFRLADNKVGEIATWDREKEKIELDEITLDMADFGFDLSFDPVEAQDIDEIPEDEDDGGYYGDERERTNRAYHLEMVDPGNLTKDFWQMPIIRKTNFVPDELIGFNYAKTSERKDVGIHFYVDDYQFERVWNYPEKYIDILMEYDCILTPDFSLYLDMPMPMKIWNIYRSRQIGAYYQGLGLNVIPTISWAEKETFDFCFRGIEKGGVVSISTVGVKKDKNALKIWREGVDEMIKQIEPRTILLYGGRLEYDFGEIEIREFENKVTENWKGR